MKTSEFDKLFTRYLKVRAEIRSNQNVSMDKRHLAANLFQHLYDEGFGYVLLFEVPALEKIMEDRQS